MKNQNNNSALYTLITVFFFGDSLRIKRHSFPLKHISKLTNSSTAGNLLFMGRILLVLILFIWSSYSKKDILNNWGYKKGIPTD